jgi:hypothetical protein
MNKKGEESLSETMRRFLHTDPKEVEKLEKKEKENAKKNKKKKG